MYIYVCIYGHVHFVICPRMGYHGDTWPLMERALVGWALMAPPGPYGPGPNGPGPHAHPWALMGRALIGRALMGPPGPYWAGP